MASEKSSDYIWRSELTRSQSVVVAQSALTGRQVVLCLLLLSRAAAVVPLAAVRRAGVGLLAVAEHLTLRQAWRNLTGYWGATAGTIAVLVKLAVALVRESRRSVGQPQTRMARWGAQD